MLVHLPSQTEDVLYAVTQLHAFVGDPKTIFYHVLQQVLYFLCNFFMIVS
jgi:hypothetical protein